MYSLNRLLQKEYWTRVEELLKECKLSEKVQEITSEAEMMLAFNWTTCEMEGSNMEDMEDGEKEDEEGETDMMCKSYKEVQELCMLPNVTDAYDCQ